MSLFSSESALCAEFIRQIDVQRRGWTAFPETAGFDLLLVHRTGMQIGVEAKLRLNLKVVDQVLPESLQHELGPCPDFRAVLVPSGECHLGLAKLCLRVGVTVIQCNPDYPAKFGGRHLAYHSPSLPLPDGTWGHEQWFDWCPAQRCEVPDWVPDVQAGVSAPTKLTQWKVAAIKLVILLGRRGYLTPQDFKHFEVSPSRWTQSPWLQRGSVRGIWLAGRLPDFRAQHPVNYAQIEADFEKWAPPGWDVPQPAQGDMLGRVA